MQFPRSLTVCVTATALSLLTASAHANFVTNGSFELTTLNTKGNFAGNVTGWSGGAKLTYLAFPGTATTGGIPVYAGFPALSPDGGNFVQADGDPNYSSMFEQTLNGLVAGQGYTLTFYQASGQQNGFTGATTERWSVGFGATTTLSDLMSIPQGSYTPWEKETMNFVASATTQVLSFLAVGTPNGEPPVSFLDGVDVESSVAVPEPATWLILGAGLAGLAAMRRRKAIVAG